MSLVFRIIPIPALADRLRKSELYPIRHMCNALLRLDHENMLLDQ